MPASPGEALLSAFTPSLMSHETLEAIFVQREPLLRRIVCDIRDSAGAPTKRHYLLVGPRGIGKTHLVSLAYHRVQADPDLHERLRIAWLREEERGVVSFLHLLRRILLRLAEEYGDDALAEKAGTLFQHPDGEREGERLLLEWLGDHTLLLIAENLDDLFRRMSEDSRRPRPTARYQGAGGGHPRIWILFVGFMTRDTLDALVPLFLKMLDDLTPYYQARMDALPDQQALIVEYLVERRHAVTVKEIAAGCGLAENKTSAQLAELGRKGYVRSEREGRESYYELREPLMRLSLEVKDSCGKPLRRMVDFLQIWHHHAGLPDKLTFPGNDGHRVKQNLSAERKVSKCRKGRNRNRVASLPRSSSAKPSASPSSGATCRRSPATSVSSRVA
jgi:Uncharacterized membrane-associated protein/domain